MEDALVLSNAFSLQMLDVLILVLMEDALVPLTIMGKTINKAFMS